MTKLSKVLMVLVPILALGGIVAVLLAKQPEQVSNQPNGDNSGQTKSEVITSEVDTSDWQTYRNEEVGFEIRHPKNFSFKEGDKFEVDIVGCYILITEDGNKLCDNKGNAYFDVDINFQPGTSLEAFDYTYSKYKEERAKFGIGLPGLLSLKRVVVNGAIYYQAEYFGGDSNEFETYIPTGKELLVYHYDVSPKENDPDTKYHEKVAKAMLQSLKVGE